MVMVFSHPLASGLNLQIFLQNLTACQKLMLECLRFSQLSRQISGIKFICCLSFLFIFECSFTPSVSITITKTVSYFIKGIFYDT